MIERISEGDEVAFRQLFNHYYPKVLAFLGYFISVSEDTRDIAQNIFAKIWLMRKTLPDIKSFGAYLYRLSRNAAVDYCRKKHIKVSITDNYQDLSDTSADEEYFARESRSQYQSCLEKMPERRREVFSLSREEGLTNEEISKRLGISKKTVENHINAALRDIRKIVSCISIFF
ncbi:MAG: RNA polymerase sigma-70 factor [Bacteroidales bacterium]|nr:RNA polymerase sigma-70 factor [Bacteroidales bacterium]